MAAGDGIPEFVTPYNTSEFEAMVQTIVTHFNAVRGQAEVVAVDLRRLLPRAKNVQGRHGWAGLDLKLAAFQVARQFTQVAAAQNASAAAANRGLSLFHGNFTNPSGNHGRGFDAGR